MEKHVLTPLQALEKARAYCARQERAHQEVRDKLYSWGLHKEEVEQLLVRLIGEDLLNEQRFAEAYALGKHRQKGWGRAKIRQGLVARRVSAPCIRQALNALDPEEYQEELERLVRKRLRMERSRDPYVRRNRTIAYLIGRGYEADLVAATVDGTIAGPREH